MNTPDYLDALRERLNIRSDWKLAQEMGWSEGTVYNYRKGATHFQEDTAIQVAEILGMDPLHVLADSQAQRTKSPAAREHWERLSRLVGAVAIVGVAGLLGMDLGAAAAAGGVLSITDPGTHYAHFLIAAGSLIYEFCLSASRFRHRLQHSPESRLS